MRVIGCEHSLIVRVLQDRQGVVFHFAGPILVTYLVDRPDLEVGNARFFERFLELVEDGNLPSTGASSEASEEQENRSPPVFRE